MNPSLSPSRMPVRALADRQRGRDETFGCCRSMLKKSSHKPHTERGGRAFGVKHPAFFGERTCSCTPTRQSHNVCGNCPQSGFNGRKQRYTIPRISNFGRHLQKLLVMGIKIIQSSPPQPPVRNLSVTSGESQPLGTTEPNCGPNVKPQRNTALTMMSGRHRQ